MSETIGLLLGLGLAAAVIVGLAVTIAHLVRTTLISYRFDDTSLRIMLAGRLCLQELKYQEILSVEEIGPGRILPIRNLVAAVAFRSRVWGIKKTILVTRKPGIRPNVVVTPDNPEEFLAVIRRKAHLDGTGRNSGAR